LYNSNLDPNLTNNILNYTKNFVFENNNYCEITPNTNFISRVNSILNPNVDGTYFSVIQYSNHSKVLYIFIWALVPPYYSKIFMWLVKNYKYSKKKTKNGDE